MAIIQTNLKSMDLIIMDIIRLINNLKFFRIQNGQICG